MNTRGRLVSGVVAPALALALIGCHTQSGLVGTDAGVAPDSVVTDAQPDRAPGQMDLRSGAGGASVASSGGSTGLAGSAGFAGADGAGSGGSTSVGAGGSGTAGAGGSGGMGTGGGGGRQICAIAIFDPDRGPVDLFVVLDRSASMADDASGQLPTALAPSKWTEATQALTQIIGDNDPSHAFAWGLKAFPETGAECANESVTLRVDVPIAIGNGGAITASIAALAPTGNGTPTGAAIRAATTYLSSLSDDRHKYLLLVTDGEPGCVGSPGALMPGLVGAAADTVSALTSAAAAGFHTFVVGVATTNSSASATLNMLAVAGLEPRADPRPGATRYYLASTKDELVSALRTITGAVGTCSFPLNFTPPVPTDVSVTIGSAVAPHDPTRINGWEYAAGGNPLASIQVYGAWCDAIRTPAMPQVIITFGCP